MSAMVVFIVCIALCLTIQCVLGDVECTNPGFRPCGILNGTSTCCCSVKTANCTFNDYLKAIPALPPNISVLFFENKNLQNLSNKTFANITQMNLKELHLKRNGIVTLAEFVFGLFPKLQVLDLSDNVNINISDLRVALGNVQKANAISIKLQNITLSDLPNDFFCPLNRSKVKHLNLGRNNIIRLNMTVFENLKYLKTLFIEGSLLEHVTPPRAMESLKILSLSGNRFKSFPRFCSDPESPFKNLTHLKVSNNYIDNLYSEAWSCLDKLVHLDIQQNRINILNMSVFSNLNALKSLNVHSNWIKRLNPENGSNTLESINLGKNELSFPPWMCKNDSSVNLFPKLLYLDLSHNYIQSIRVQSWNCLNSLTNLSMSGNIMRVIRNNSFSSLTNLKHLELAKMQGKLKTIESLAFNNSNLVFLKIQSNSIYFASDESMRRIFEHCKNLEYLDISHNSFRSLNETSITQILKPLSHLQSLFMANMRLNRLPKGFLNMFTNLTTLNLNENLIEDIYLQQTLNTSTPLKLISLRYNYIRIITNTTFNRSLLSSLEKLDLSSNPLDCTCEMRWFRNLITDDGRAFSFTLKKWPYGYKCQTPSELKRTFFKDYKPTLDSCKPFDPMIVAYSVIGCFIFVFTVISLVVYKNRWYLTYLYYRLKRRTQATDPEKTKLLNKKDALYDAYVIYNDDDRGFVHGDFIKLVEENQSYTLNIWHRDADLGVKCEVMLDGIYASKNVIAIVSKNFLKDSWCQFQLEVSIDRQVELKRDNLMLVILDDVNLKQLSKYWCVMLTKTPTAYWCYEKQNIKRHVFVERIKEHLGRSVRQPRNASRSNSQNHGNETTDEWVLIN